MCSEGVKWLLLDWYIDYSVCKKIFKTKKILTFTTQEGFSSNSMASSTAYQLGKSLWSSQILLVCRLGTGSALSETQTLTSSSTTLALGLIGSVCYPTIFRLSTRGSKLRLDLSLGRYMVLRQHSGSTAEEKQWRLQDLSLQCHSIS